MIDMISLQMTNMIRFLQYLGTLLCVHVLGSKESFLKKVCKTSKSKTLTHQIRDFRAFHRSLSERILAPNPTSLPPPVPRIPARARNFIP
jgi:hypothetical protein